MPYIDSCTKAFVAGGAIGANILVKLSAGVLAVAGASEVPIGVTEQAAFAAGDVISVRLLNSCGTIEMTAGAAITAGATVFGIANGKIDDADPSSGVKVGVALEAATANGDIIEVLPALQL